MIMYFRLQAFDNWVLEGLGKHFAFEIIVGANGKFILNAGKCADVIRLGNVILASEGKDVKWLNEQIKQISRLN